MTPDEWIHEALATAPPLTDEKRREIVRLLSRKPVNEGEVAS